MEDICKKDLVVRFFRGTDTELRVFKNLFAKGRFGVDKSAAATTKNKRIVVII